MAAEALFAERGIEAVSLREIAALAKHGNNNAVQYYFGTKAGLVDAIFEHRVSQMEDQRREMLVQAEAANLLDDALTLMQILCLPHLSLVNDEGQYPYAGFMGQYLTRNRPVGLRHAADLNLLSSQQLRRLLNLIAKRISYLPLSIAESRTAICNLMFVNVLIRWNHTPANLRDSVIFNQLIRDTIEIATDSLCAPFRAGRGDHDWNASLRHGPRSPNADA